MNIFERLRNSSVPALGLLGLGQDVDVPAGQHRGQANVLAAPADREAELVVGHDDLDPVLSSSSTTLATSAGASALTTKVAGIVRPGNDVDLLALQLADDRLDAAAAHADAGADRIDRAVVRDHRDLGAAAGIAGDRP